MPTPDELPFKSETETGDQLLVQRDGALYRTPTDAFVGEGVPAGGVAGQFLQKTSGVDYDTQWTIVPALTDGDKGDIIVSGTTTVWEIDPNVLTTYARTLTASIDASGARSVLGLGSAALQPSSAFAAAVHTHVATDVTDFNTTVNGLIATQKGANNGLATLDGSGKVPTSQLPPLAISNTFVVASQVAMLALTAEPGDIAVRTDLSKSFILSADPASTLSNWQELLSPTDSVLSVNGQTGAVVLTTSNIAEGSNLYFTDERAQDAVGNSLVDSSTINFTYNDGANQITADLIPSAVDINTLGGTPLSVGNGGTGAVNPSDARTSLGLAIGTDVQAYNARLQDIANNLSASSGTVEKTGANTFGTYATTAFAKTVLDDTTASAVKATIEIEKVELLADTVFSSTNFDNFTTQGNFVVTGSSYTNPPFASPNIEGYLKVTVRVYSAVTVITQEYTHMNTADTGIVGRKWTRTRNASTWSAWTNISASAGETKNQLFVATTDFTPGSTTILTLTTTPISPSSASLNIYFDGIKQHNVSANFTYNTSTGAITFTSAIPVWVKEVFTEWESSSLSIGTPSAGTVDYSKLASSLPGSQADLVAGTAQKVVMADVLKSMRFVSAEQTVVAASGASVAHGLGAVPTELSAYLVCKTAEKNFAVGDRLMIPGDTRDYSPGTGQDRGVQVWCDGTNVKYRVGASGILLNNANSGASGAFITAANWRLVIVAKL